MTTKKRTPRTTSPRGFVIGPAAFEKISAIEDVEYTDAMRTRAAEFERQGLSIEECRLVLIEAYRPRS